MAKFYDAEGAEVEAFLPDEVNAKVTEAVTAKESEFGKTKAEIEKERDEARTALNERTGEFKQFRKLNEDVVAKLSIAEKAIYDNQLFQKEQEDKRIADDLKNREMMRDNAIRAKVGSDEKLFGKVKDMYAVIGLEANTPEDINKKVLASLGALGQVEPDLIATVNGFSSGSFEPPQVRTDDEKSFADSEKGKRGAAELGLKL
jgi:hypothetical protein